MDHGKQCPVLIYRTTKMLRWPGDMGDKELHKQSHKQDRVNPLSQGEKRDQMLGEMLAPSFCQAEPFKGFEDVRGLSLCPISPLSSSLICWLLQSVLFNFHKIGVPGWLIR